MFVYLLIFILVNYRNVEADIPQDPKSLLPRTLFGIIWSCLSTTIICAWTSVHPNVPPPNQWKARLNRLWLMIWMMIAPELVLAWAVRQYFGAREIRDEYNNRHPDFPIWRKWTLKHGHLLQMGGFLLIDPDQKYADPNEQHGTVLTVDYFKENPTIDIPLISAAEIEDRSKGDTLTKIIAIPQTTWFITQCIARGQQGLALTELELVTLALASLNAVTFGIWWHKPLGVQEPVRIYLKVEAVKVTIAAQRMDNSVSFDGVIGKGWETVEDLATFAFEFLKNPCKDGPIVLFLFLIITLPIILIYIITFPFFVLFPLGTVFLLRIIKTEPVPEDTSRTRGFLANQIIAFLQTFRYRLTSRVSRFVENKLQRTFGGDLDFAEIFTVFLFNRYILLPLLYLLFSLFIIFLIPFFTLVVLVSFIFTAAFGIVTTDSIHPGASHVPSFYSPTAKSDRWTRMVVFALFGVIFGGLHCVGWNFKFATDSEQSLWRATSLAITVIPLIVAPIDYLLALRLRIRDINSCGRFERGGLLILDLVMTILLFIYVLARLSLIAQALALLRSPPPDALTAVNWTKYIPHLFSS